jgi:hypothetical protein
VYVFSVDTPGQNRDYKGPPWFRVDVSRAPPCASIRVITLRVSDMPEVCPNIGANEFADIFDDGYKPGTSPWFPVRIEILLINKTDVEGVLKGNL